MKERLSRIVTDLFGDNMGAKDVTTDNTAAWDSLGHLNLILALEEEFGVDIPPEAIAELHQDFHAVLVYLESKVDSPL